MTVKTRNLFISHSWSYDKQYAGLISLLDASPRFKYKNYSVPKDDPIHNAGSQKELKQAIKRQIDLSQIVIIMAGVYATYSKWINIEIEIAQGYSNSKPILAVEYWGSERTSKIVKDNANLIVKWNGSSIVDAIRKLVP